jgi:hypothetical protein
MKKAFNIETENRKKEFEAEIENILFYYTTMLTFRKAKTKCTRRTRGIERRDTINVARQGC